MTNAEFVKAHYGQALVASKGSGIFIETLLGQSILETSRTIKSRYRQLKMQGTLQAQTM